MHFFITHTAEEVINSKLKTKTGRDKKISQIKYKYVLNHILSVQTYKEDEYKKGVPISTELLTDLFGKGSEVARIIKDLRRWKLIIKYRKEKIHHYCAKYKLHRSIENEGTYKILVSATNSPLIGRIEKWNEEKRYSYKEQLDIFKKYVRVNQEGKDHLDETYKDVPKKAMRRRDMVLQCILDKDFWSVRPDVESRVYTSLTSLKREYRDYITIDGKPFLATDISCSQIVLTVPLIHKYWLNCHPNLDDLPADVIRFQKLAESPHFYEAIGMEIGEEFTPSQRTAFKKKVFREIWFSRNNYELSPIRAAFKRLFPTVYKIIWELKKKDHRSFAIALQRFEASVIIDCVWKRMNDEGLIALTIHDSVVVNSFENLVYAEKLIAEELSKYNISPHFKRDGLAEIKDAA